MRSEWLDAQLADLITIKHGFAFKGEHFTDVPTPQQVVTLGNFAVGGGFKLGRGKFYSGPVPPEYVLGTGDVVVTMTDLSRGGDTLGFAGTVPETPGTTWLHNQRIGLVQLKPKAAVRPGFLHFLMRSGGYRHWVASSATGSTVKHTSPGRICSYRFKLPPLEEQKGIDQTLSSLEDRIALLRETNATLEAIAQALFKSWFVDFDPVHAKQQGIAPAGMDEATAALFPDKFEETPLGLAPNGWSIRRVEEIAERVGMGPFGSNIKVSTFVDDGTPVLNGSNVQGALLEDGAFRFVTEEHAARLRNSCVRAGDIVLTHRGTLGQVALVPSHSKFAEYVLSQSQFFMRCDLDLMRPEWMLYFLRSPLGQHLLLSNASQVGVPSIARPTSNLRSMKLVVPSIDLVRRFAEVARSLHGAIVGNRGRAGTLTSLRDTLLPRLISGQLRLPEVA
ncbi:MAG TPA: restriction endonuclease subunit S [Caldimonas sp.]